MAQPKKDVIVSSLDEFPDGSHRVVQAGRRAVGVFRIDGSFYALPNLCPHQLGPLCQGRVSGTLIATAETEWRRQWVREGEIVTCPWHGLEFHVPTGQCLAFPEIQLRTYEVRVEDGQVKLCV